MVKYKITFDLDIEAALEYNYQQSTEILEINDTCFDETFDTDSKVKEFEDWFNEGQSENEKISIIDIVYSRNGDEECILEVTSKSEIQDAETFAKELVSYLFEGDYPTVEYHVTGSGYEDYWDYYKDSPEQREVKVDYEDSANIRSYLNLVIVSE